MNPWTKVKKWYRHWSDNKNSQSVFKVHNKQHLVLVDFTMGGLTDEQKRRIEENRQRALQRRAQNFAQKGSVASSNNQSKPTWHGSAKVSNPSSANSATVGSAKASFSNTSISRNINSGSGKNFTQVHPQSSAGREFQASTVKRFTGYNSASSNQSSVNTNAISTGNKVTNTFTSIHPPSTGGGSVKNTGNVSANLHSNPAFQSKPSSTKTFQPHSKSSSVGISTTHGTGPSGVANKSSYETSKSTLSFYSSKPTSSSNSKKPSFTSSSNSSYRSKGSFFKHDSNQTQQKQWQKFQPGGSSSGSSAPGSGNIASSVYGGGLNGKCVLISSKRFEVDVTYHAKLIEIFKQMSTKSYGKLEDCEESYKK